MKANTLKSNSGLTLIEVLVSVSILGILGSGILGLQYIIGQNQTQVFNSFLQLDDANEVALQFSKEFRLARSGDNGAYAIESADDNQIIFYSDIDLDGDTERVRYFLDDSDFSKGVIEPTTIPITYPSEDEIVKLLSDNVRNSTSSAFTYYNEDWPTDTLNNPLSTPADTGDVKLVKIFLRINSTTDDPDGDFIIETFSQSRLLKQNL